jgi:phosphoribosylformylglycinamidine synthase
VAADPYEGGKQAVAEAYRNLTAVGATPIAITDNLNFGNPEKPETMGYIIKAIEGMAEACRALDFPVVSGNVSLYNETDGIAIPPTPVCGGVGLIEDVSKIATLKGAQAGDTLILIGETKGHMGASLYAREILGLEGEALGPPPPVDLEVEMKNAAFVRSLIEQGLVNAVHDVSDGGLACAAAEMALSSGVGVVIELSTLVVLPSNNNGTTMAPPECQFFAECQGGFLIAVPHETADQIANDLGPDSGVTVHWAGRFEGNSIALNYEGGSGEAPSSGLPLAKLRAAHEGWMPAYMGKVD